MIRAVSSAGTSVWFTPRMSGVRSSHCPEPGHCTRLFLFNLFFSIQNLPTFCQTSVAPLLPSCLSDNPKKELALFFLTDFRFEYVGSSILSLPIVAWLLYQAFLFNLFFFIQELPTFYDLTRYRSFGALSK